MKKIFFTSFLLAMLAQSAFSQQLGLRVGYLFTPVVALDGVFEYWNQRGHVDLSFGKDGVALELLSDFIHEDLLEETVSIYVGAGLYTHAKTTDSFLVDFCGELGFEYQLPDSPYTISVDWRPSISGFDDFNFQNGGLNIRYVFDY